jgi:putative flippase GtrA
MMKNSICAVRQALQLQGDITSIFSVGVRQLACGGVSAVLDMLVFQGLLCLGATGIVWAVNWGFAIGLSSNYCMNRLYTFRYIKQYQTQLPIQVALHIFSAIVSLLITQAVVWFFTQKAMFLPVIAKAISIGVVYLWSLFAMRKIIFRAAK